ncbi:hypothetical protein C0Q70_00620 [Pomacea canaliculata]|uniref:Disintegrin domain-containing protein n=1 Tax=Pomacea canaliculata TaxID=400727 RepID=A0A2T7PX66_POMCA|nr:hypothetical protein C0Q70_00620 [Pomacea canaliculata]
MTERNDSPDDNRHNWGSPHDPEGECSPSDQEGGRYIMYPSAPPQIQINSMFTSELTRQSAQDEIHCGNGVVDIREECDAGADGLEGKDKCCSSICLLRENARCRQFPFYLQQGECVPKEDAACGNEASALTADVLPRTVRSLEIRIIGATEPACVIVMRPMPANTAVRRTLATRNTANVSQQKRLLVFENPATTQGKCVPEEDVPCGNGVLDKNEECDAGEESVKNQDKCCNRTCHLKESAQCRGQCINGRCITTYCKELGEKDNRRYRACMCDHDGEIFA